MTHKRGKFLIVSIVLSIMFYIFYLKERLVFNESKSETTLEAMQTYFIQYPNGRYVKELEVIEEKLAFNNVKIKPSMFNVRQYYEFCGKGSRTETVMFKVVQESTNIDIVRSFIAAFPKSKYASQSKRKLNDLWTEEFNIYEEAVKNAGNTVNKKSVVFFRELLRFMRSNDLSQIYVKFNRTTHLKDYVEYSKNAKTITQQFYSDHPVESNIISLKDNFSEGNLESLEVDVIEEMKSVFFGIFTNNFFALDNELLSAVNPGPNDLVLQISYEIESQEVDYLGMKLPNLWTYTEKDQNYMSSAIFKGYIIGIDVRFSFDFKIPNSNVAYTFQYIGNPGDNISGFTNMNEAYGMMVRNTFTDFINNISNNFGLTRVQKQTKPSLLNLN